jgi:hypothetical protein
MLVTMAVRERNRSDDLALPLARDAQAGNEHAVNPAR